MLFNNCNNYEVDYRGYLNLLGEAKQAGIVKFIYVSLAGGDRLRQTAYGDAHEKFVEALQASKISHAVAHPTGFFSFNLEFLKFAAKRRGLVPGKGDCKNQSDS